MGKPGPGFSYPEIIDKPELKSPLRHLAEGSLTAFLWALWVYWILPLFTLFLWLAGFRYFFERLFPKDFLSEFVEILKNGGLAILVILTLKLLWINYNYHLIYKKRPERRKKVIACSDRVLAQYFRLDPRILEKAKRLRRIEVTLTERRLFITSPRIILP
ncbi:MAG: poly-beta-1,6-N-acetyl-D-glucosamine biosynthesis protein PgaD [Candidatus Omnitrophota bacterium]